MADGLTDGRVALKAGKSRNIVPGVVALTLGLLALAIAAVEYYVFADMGASTGGGNHGFGTMAYVAGYAGAGFILIAVGVLKICRA